MLRKHEGIFQDQRGFAIYETRDEFPHVSNDWIVRGRKVRFENHVYN